MRLQKAFEYPKIETAILGIGKQVNVDRFSVPVAKAQVCTSDQTEGCKRFLAHQYSESLFQQRRYRFIVQVAIVSHFAMSCLYGMCFSENRFRGQ